MKNLLHGKVSFFVMAADFIPVWYLKGNAVSLQDKLHSKELLIYDAGWKNKTNLSKRGGTLSGQIKKNKRTYWVSLGRLKKGLDSHRRKVSLYGAEKLLHNIHPKWRRLSRWEAYTIQVYNTEKPCKRTCTGFNAKFKWIISPRHLVKLALEQCSLFNAFFF